jgi:pimeloyl-ACP methyl ester carboxylesterase
MESVDTESLLGHLPYVFESGTTDPTRPSIVWLHGGTESHHEFTQVISHIPEYLYHHILLDLPGHGVQAEGDFSIEAAMNNIEAAIRGYAHKGKCYIVGLSLGGVTALCLLRNRPDFVGEHVAKIFVTSPRLKTPQYGTVIIVIAVPLVRLFLFLYSFRWIGEALERKMGFKIPYELAADMARWASLSRLLRPGKNLPRPEVQDNIREQVDLSLMLCMASKEPIERLFSVEEVMKEKVTECQSVIALGQMHL